jgi:hypothetical protein
MKVIATAMVVFVGGMGLVIGYRMEQQTMAILAGTAVGFIVAAFAVGAVGYVLIHQTKIHHQQRNFQPPYVRYENDRQSALNSAWSYQPQAYPYSAAQQIALLNQHQHGMPNAMLYYSSPINDLIQNQSSMQNMQMKSYYVPSARKFYVIGGNGETEELLPAMDDVQNIYDL